GATEISYDAPTATSASSKASTSTSEPLLARPIGVRAAATMTASVTEFSFATAEDASISLRVEPDGAVESDDMSVDVAVGHQVLDELRKLLGSTESAWEGHFALQCIDEIGGRLVPCPGPYGARGHGVDTDPDSGQVARGDHRHADDSGFCRSVGDLADLSLIACDRGGGDDRAPLSVIVLGLKTSHCGGGQSERVERCHNVEVQ